MHRCIAEEKLADNFPASVFLVCFFIRFYELRQIFPGYVAALLLYKLCVVFAGECHPRFEGALQMIRNTR